MRLRLGTRGSALAVGQSELVAEQLRALGHTVELVRIRTGGDVERGSLTRLGTLGIFAAELRTAILDGRCDFAVHSYKDLPTAPVPGLAIAAVPVRADARDALCARDGLTLAGLPAGAKVGTGSPRRVAQLLRRRPDLVVRGIRGNVDTRLRKVDEGEYDAIVLAEAGLTRIGRTDRISERFDADGWPPSAGQGALAVEVRTGVEGDDSAAVRDAVARITDADAEVTALLERAVLRRLEAGCAAPVGIAATLEAEAGADPDAGTGRVALVAEVYALDGARAVRVAHDLTRAEVADDAGRAAAAERVVADLLARGAGELADLAGSGR